MYTHTLCFRRLKKLKWAQGSQWTKKRSSNFADKKKLLILFDIPIFNALDMIKEILVLIMMTNSVRNCSKYLCCVIANHINEL